MTRWVLAVLALGAAAVLGATGLAAAPTAVAHLGVELVVIGCVVVALALWQWPAGLAVGVVLVVLPWGIALIDRPDATGAVALGAGVVVLVELAGWSLDSRTVVPQSPSRVALTAGRTVGLAGAGAAVSAVLLAAAALPAPGSLVRLVLGLGATAALVAFAALRRWER